MDFDEALRQLEQRSLFGIAPGLERITALCELMDHPQHRFPSVHITGTNGKTTVARITARILDHHGIRAGLYTSPHLQSVLERICASGEQIKPEEFSEVFSYLVPFVELVEKAREDKITYFELLTAMAYVWMAEKPVDAGVFEVGMGGRWDATNLLRTEVAVFTPIGVDHVQYLGPTALSAAEEKVGIIKPGAHVVCALQDTDVAQRISNEASEKGCALALEGRDFSLVHNEMAHGGRYIDVHGTHGTYRGLFLPMHGEHQAHSAALAVAAAESFVAHELHWPSLAKALSRATSPGRLEVIRRRPGLILDGAHNAQGAQVLARTLREEFVYRSLIVVIAVMDDKDVETVAGEVLSLASYAVLTVNSSPRSATAARLEEVARRLEISFEIAGNVHQAIERALGVASEDDLILVTGSLVTVGDAREMLARTSASA